MKPNVSLATCFLSKIRVQLNQKCREETYLIEHNISAARQHEISVLQHVDESPGRRDDDLAALAQLEALILAGDAADDGNGADPERPPELARLLLDLLSQLARRRQDDGVRSLVGVLKPAQRTK